MGQRICSPEELEGLARDALTASGASRDAADSLARAVVAAELDGIASHGLAYIPTYCEHLRCGKVRPLAEPRAQATAASAILVDADHGFAHPAIDKGLPLLMEAARSHGVAGMAVRRSYNCGVLGYHTEQLAAAGLVGLGFTNAPASIAPLGGTRPVIGTNPFSLAVPGEHPGEIALLIDQSASVVAKSEVMAHKRRGQPLPAGWALDASGQPTTDPDAALAGSMMPAGGYKGFGSGLMTEVLAAVLAGGALGTQASPFSGTQGGPPGTGQFFLAMDPDSFSGSAFQPAVQGLIAAMDEQPGVRVPGRRRRDNRLRLRQAGIPVASELLDRVQSLVRT
ncbi:(2R)-3-sulfolactate dehydrogenase (NADP+) [Natronocella acetinitrilica]|uniref:(2R)-3-sulfolactate dehydrogenase (NADP+) n=1 Tax=Natronocella acetinitrilica TaxID=414046 RepID=A0AAE3G6F4_9GAMM|nr:Ldh family oxidoreductase [Natronocella acetinitrilica]MCP1675253.1 (2R)-3-sulfolactate dehydrogenase (NADP+) [Natronocella acetinitrilica]